MKAIQIDGFGDPDVLKAIELDRPEPGPGEVRIEVKAAGVNRPDCAQRIGIYPPPPGAPDTPGLEVAGYIEAVGDGVTDLAVGDEVCALVAGGGYAEFCVAPQETVLPRPANLSWEEAACLPETFFTVWNNVFDLGALQEGQALLVHGGSSGIGTTAIQMAKLFGAKVIVTAGTEEKCKACLELGADLAINYKTQNFVEEVLTFTEGQGANVVLDMVGGDYVARNVECMAVGGRMISIAFLNGMVGEFNVMSVMVKGLTLTGSTLRPRDNAFKGAIAKNLLEKVWPLIEKGQLCSIIDQVFSLDNAAGAHARMEGGAHIGKIVLKV